MTFNLLFDKANNLYINGAYQEAEKLYRQILAFAPENSDVLNMLGLIATAKNENNAAVAYFYEALKKAPNPLPIYFNLAVCLTNLSKFEEAIEAYKHVLSLSPNTKEAYNNLGGIYEKTGNLLKAQECYHKAVELDENYIDPKVNLAILSQNFEELQRLAQKFDTSPLPLYYMALACFDHEDFSQAFDLASKADSMEDAYDIKNLLAQISLKQNDKEASVKYFHQALLLNPQSIDALINLGTLEQNETYIKKALSLDPQSFEAHLSYADFLYAENRKSEALEEYRQAVLINPENSALSNNLALILKDLQDYNGALDLMMNAFIKDKNNQNIAVNIAETLVLLHEKEPDEALKVARLWQKNAPDNVFAEHTLAAFEKKDGFNHEDYAKVLFDEFSSVYEERMENIGYNIFNKINRLKIKIKGPVLDLGCGTGLAAEKLKTLNAEWFGVDISGKMLEIAKQKNLYKQLFETDILSFLEINNINFNFIFLLDVIEYTKDFEKILNLCFPSNLLLTIEKAPSDVQTFSISQTGRYQHNPLYIENLLKTIGYQDVQMHQLTLRKENGKNVEGVLFFCTLD